MMKENKYLTLKLGQKKEENLKLHLMILSKNQVLFVKIGARVLDLAQYMSSRPKWPKCNF